MCNLSRNDSLRAQVGHRRTPTGLPVELTDCPNPLGGRPWWLLLVAVPFYSIGTGVAFAVLGCRRRSPTLKAWPALYIILVALALIFAPGSTASLSVLAVVWVAGSAHLVLSILHGPATERWGFDPDLIAAKERIERRKGAKAIAAEDPSLAREAGIGRPGAGWGVLDLNRATADEITTTLELSPAEAEKVVEARAILGRFSSLAELVVMADLSFLAAEVVAERGVLL